MQMSHDVFISYAWSDGSQYANQLEQSLETQGYRTWRDKRGIDPHLDFSAEIENAIGKTRYVVVCLTPDTLRENSFVRREIVYAQILKKPIFLLRFADIIPPITVVNHTYADAFKQAWQSVVDQLREWFGRYVNGAQAVPKPHTTIAQDPYKDYLETLYQEIVIYLNQTVIQLIDVQAQNDPDAVPKRQKSLLTSFLGRAGIHAPEVHISSLDDGMEKHNGRMLLLGNPGAGKTIALMAYARSVVANRLNNPQAPLPILLRCATWNASPPESLSAWIARETNVVWHDQTANNSVLLLDGLDELGSAKIEKIKDSDGIERDVAYDPRLRFLQYALPVYEPVILSCRAIDYAEIGEKAHLNGAVMLQPLTDVQIHQYLVELPALWEALQSDTTLMDVARTPLLLSLFAYGYQDAPEDVHHLRLLTTSEVNEAIFRRYVHERYAHEERRLRDMGKEPPFTLEKIYDVLGHVAMIIASGNWRVRGIYESWGKIQDVVLARDFLDKLSTHRVQEFIQYALHLNLLIPSGGETRFIHAYLRDHFLRDYGYPRLHESPQHVLPLYPNIPTALGSLPNGEAVPYLTQLLKSRSVMLRRCVLEGLRKTKHPSAIEPLLNVIQQDADKTVRWEAAQALTDIQGERGKAQLLEWVQHHADPEVRILAIDVLAQIGDTAMIAVLLDVLRHDPNPSVRRFIATTLGYGKRQEIVPVLLDIIQHDSDAPLRASCLIALGYLGNTTFIEMIVQVLQTDDIALVRESAVKALKRIHTPKSIHALADMLLHDARPKIRQLIATTLGEMNSDLAIPSLCHVATHDLDGRVRVLALKAIAKSTHPLVVPTLVHALNDSTKVMWDNVSDLARQALENMNTPESQEALSNWVEQKVAQRKA